MRILKEFWKSYRSIIVSYPIIVVSFAVLYWLLATLFGTETSVLSDPLQAVYFSVVTFTSLGYGDISPEGINKVVAVVEAAVGLVFLGLMISRVFQVIMESTSDKKLNPIRKGIAIKLLKSCKSVFNDAYHMIQSEANTDLKALEFPQGITQDQANYWTKSQFVRQIDRERKTLEKLINMNASILREGYTGSSRILFGY